MVGKEINFRPVDEEIVVGLSGRLRNMMKLFETSVSDLEKTGGLPEEMRLRSFQGMQTAWGVYLSGMGKILEGLTVVDVSDKRPEAIRPGDTF